MTPTHPAGREFYIPIDEITIDCYNEDEALMGFENAFAEDAHLPRPGSVLGEPTKSSRSALATAAAN